MSGGLAVGKSDLQSGVTGSMGWTSGDLASFFRGPSPPPPVSGDANSAGRRLQRKGGGGGGDDPNADDQHAADDAKLDQAWATLRSKLATWGVAVCFLGLVLSLVHLYWHTRANRRYYAQKAWENKTGKRARKGIAFRAFPGALVAPNLLMLATKFFLPGFVEPAATILAASNLGALTLAHKNGTLTSAESERLFSSYLACVVFAFVGAFLVLVLTLLAHFHVHHRDASWKVAEEAETPNDVEDPLFRLVSRVRVRVLPKGRPFNVMDRPRGEWTKPAKYMIEPSRTRRLLRQPLRLFRDNPADALDVLKLTWFTRANGGTFAGVAYDLVALVISVVVGILSGLGATIEPSSNMATAQVVAVMSMQYAGCLYTFMLSPSADRIDQLIQGIQFFVEGSQTAVLLVGASLLGQGDMDGSNACMTAGFWLGMAAMFLPLVEKIYDALISQISACCRGEFDPKGAFVAFVSLLLVIPSTIMAFLGADSDAFDAMDEALGVGDDILEDGLGALGDVAGDIFFMHLAAKRRKRKERDAATTVARIYRAYRVRRDMKKTLPDDELRRVRRFWAFITQMKDEERQRVAAVTLQHFVRKRFAANVQRAKGDQDAQVAANVQREKGDQDAQVAANVQRLESLRVVVVDPFRPDRKVRPTPAPADPPPAELTLAEPAPAAEPELEPPKAEPESFLNTSSRSLSSLTGGTGGKSTKRASQGGGSAKVKLADSEEEARTAVRAWLKAVFMEPDDLK